MGRSQVQRQIRSGRVTVGAETVYKAGTEVAAGASVAIRAARHELRATPEDLPLDIIYEDDDLLVSRAIFPLAESFAAVRRAFDREYEHQRRLAMIFNCA